MSVTSAGPSGLPKKEEPFLTQVGGYFFGRTVSKRPPPVASGVDAVAQRSLKTPPALATAPKPAQGNEIDAAIRNGVFGKATEEAPLVFDHEGKKCALWQNKKLLSLKIPGRAVISFSSGYGYIFESPSGYAVSSEKGKELLAEFSKALASAKGAAQTPNVSPAPTEAPGTEADAIPASLFSLLKALGKESRPGDAGSGLSFNYLDEYGQKKTGIARAAQDGSIMLSLGSGAEKKTFSVSPQSGEIFSRDGTVSPDDDQWTECNTALAAAYVQAQGEAPVYDRRVVFHDQQGHECTFWTNPRGEIEIQTEERLITISKSGDKISEGTGPSKQTWDIESSLRNPEPNRGKELVGLYDAAWDMLVKEHPKRFGRPQAPQPQPASGSALPSPQGPPPAMPAPPPPAMPAPPPPTMSAPPPPTGPRPPIQGTVARQRPQIDSKALCRKIHANHLEARSRYGVHNPALIPVIDGTLQACEEGYTTSKGQRVTIDHSRMLEGTRTFFGGKDPVKKNPKASMVSPLPPLAPAARRHTEFTVQNKDVLKVLISRKKPGEPLPVGLNLANRYGPGGGVGNGDHAQEEHICLCSDSLLSLSTQDYPLPEFGGIYSPHVTVFRNSDFSFMDKPEEVAFVASAAYDFRPGCDGQTVGRDSPLYKDNMKEKIRNTLRVMASNGHTRVVLGAMGCGVFDNNPTVVAGLFKEVFGEDEFKGRFESVDFAILANVSNPSQKQMLNAFETAFRQP